GQPFAEELLVRESDAFDAVEIVPAWLINEEAEIGRRDKRHTELAKLADHRAALSPQRPPPLQRRIGRRAGQDHRHVGRNPESFCEMRPASVADRAVVTMNDLVQRQAYGREPSNGTVRRSP